MTKDQGDLSHPGRPPSRPFGPLTRADPYPGAELNPTGDVNRHKYRPDIHAQPHPALHRHGDTAADAHLYAVPRARQTDADVHAETAHLHAGAAAREDEETAAQPNAQAAEGQ